MKQQNKLKDVFILGFAVFAMFFGAGNLIFPAGIGAMAGTRWPIALLATTLASVVLPLLALIAATRTSKGYEGLCAPVGRWYYVMTFTFCNIGISMLANLPRTAATTHEMSIAPFFPDVPIGVTVVVYFVLVFFFAIDKSNIMDKIGKFLTPLLLILMLAIIIKGFITPFGTAVPTDAPNVFGDTFTELYQTGDLFSGLLFSTVVISTIGAKGYKEGKEQGSMVLWICLVAGIAFFVIYGGLLLIGANANGYFPQGIDRTALLTGISKGLLGNIGMAMLAGSVALACLSTAAGLVSVAADFFSSLCRNRIPYIVFVILQCVIGSLIGTMGVENIINFAGPIFLTVYPSAIVLTFLGIFKKFVPNEGAYRYCVVFALVYGVLDCLNSLGVGAAGAVTGLMPLSSAGFGWILPAMAGFLIGWVKYNMFPVGKR